MQRDEDPDAILWDSIIPALPFFAAAYWLRDNWFALPWFKILGYAIYAVGCWLIARWAVRTVRLSSWFPKEHAGHGLLATVTSPLLILPAVVVNAFQSAFYLGLTLFVCQILGLLAYFYMGWKVLLLIPVGMLVAGGIVRLYAYFYGCFGDSEVSLINVVLSNLLWPVLTAWLLLKLMLYAIVSIFSGFWLIILFGIIGLFLGSGAGGMLFGAVVALLPLVFSVGAAGVMPTDISGMEMSDLGGFDGGYNAIDFDSFSVNPVNGMPMIGGMGGVDVYGNPFGTDFNDPH